MSEKHTPGPWFSERDQVGPRSQEDDQSYGMLMPVAYIERFDHPEKADANKALITVAPELLEALVYARRFLRPGDHDTEYVDSIIAKARGAS